MVENQKFGRYIINKHLGSGATSDVYLAYDTNLDREVALKILKPSLVTDQSSFNRFTKEAQSAGKLFHDHIATILDLGEEEGRYFIAMRYIEGISLDKVIKKSGSFKWDEVKKLISQVGSAIVFAHNQGFLHRDIKPNNIISDLKGNYFLTDFGLIGSMLDSGLSSTTGAILGTPAYIPPEIWNGQPASPQSDQYSFACVIHEAISGRVLFSGDTPQAVITRHLVKEPELGEYSKDVPENVHLILMKALSKDPQERFANVSEFVGFLNKPEEFQAVNQVTKKVVPGTEGSREIDGDKRRKKIKVGIWLLIFGVFALTIALMFAFGILPPGADNRKATPNTEEAAAVSTEVVTSQTTATLTTQPTPTLEPSSTTTPIQQTVTTMDADQVALGSGVTIKTMESGPQGIAAYFYDGNGNPIQNKYVRVYSQQQDLSGKWVTKEYVDDARTITTGMAEFNLPAGEYLIESDFYGYNWGTAGDVNGQASILVESGRQSQLVLRLGILRIGFVRADGKVVSNKYVRVYTQQKSISDQWVSDDYVTDGRTDNSGVAEFHLTPGNYVVEASFDGYNWGNAVDLMGEANIPVKPGEVTQLVIHLGRLVVAVKDAGGNPLNNKYIRVYLQERDINGKSSVGDYVTDGRTDATGTATFDLTPGEYCVEFAEKTICDLQLEARKTTLTDGKNTTIQ